VVLYYPPLDSKKRTQIWKNHVSRLERLRPEINVKEAVHEYLESSELQKAEFNGRQIRNIFQTAVSLALYEAASDEDRANRDPVLHSRHLKKVVGLSSAFQMYLEQTRDKDSRNAKDDELRNDSFTGSSRRR